jgi:hypothetical protein
MEEQNTEGLGQGADSPERQPSTTTPPLEEHNSIPTQSGGEHMAKQGRTTAEQEVYSPTKLYVDLVDTWSSTTRKMAEYYESLVGTYPVVFRRYHLTAGVRTGMFLCKNLNLTL